MKAILEFDLNDHDDSMAHLRAVKSLDMALAIWEIIHNSKKSIEYQIENGKYEDKYDVLYACYDKISEILNEHDINIDKIVN